MEPRTESRGEKRLQAFVDAVFDAFYDWHVPSGEMEMSSQVDALLHAAPGVVPRTYAGWLERIHPDDREQAVRSSQQAVQRGGVYEGEYRLRRGDGGYVPVRDRGMTVRDEHGDVHMIGAMRDITEEQAADRALREAAALYRTLFAQAVNPAYHIAEDGRFLDANTAGLQFLDVTRARLLRETVASLWGPKAPEAVATALKHAASVATLNLQLEKGDSFKAMVLTLLPYQLRGQSTCFALGTDLTEHHVLRRALEASEESLRRQAAALEEANTALRVILDRRNQDRLELEKTIVTNAETTVIPLLGQLRRHLGSAPEAVYADAAMHSVRELVHPFAQSLGPAAGKKGELTLREREIASMIRAGTSSSEIAKALYISQATVAFHRKNLRRKLGLGPRAPSLASYLAALPGRMQE